MSDILAINGLRINCIIGCNPEERIKPQHVIVTARLNCDCRPAGLSDCLEDAINYDQLSRQFTQIASEGNFHLIEALAERIATLCLEDSRVQQVEVTVEKPGAIPMSNGAYVTITRGNKAN